MCKALLWTGLANEGCRVYTTLVKQFAGFSLPASSSKKISMFHDFMGNPSTSEGLSLGLVSVNR